MNTATLKLFALGCLVGAAALWAAGFGYFEWSTPSYVKNQRVEAATAATVAALTPQCVAMGLSEPDKVTELKEKSSYQRHTFVEAAGWASYPEGANSSLKRKLNSACAEMLAKTEIQQAQKS